MGLHTYTAVLTFAEAVDTAIDQRLTAAGITDLKPLGGGKASVTIACQYAGNAFETYRAIARARLVGLKSLVVIRCGSDWCGMRDQTTSGWLTRHLGDPQWWAEDD